MSKIDAPEKLKELSELFPQNSPLFVVGGFVRDSLLGLRSEDIDVAAAVSPDKLLELLSDTEFTVLPVNLRVGTVIIKNGDFEAEYTSFRTDSYPLGSGAHSPDRVDFTDDIVLDAKRRDFKMNAVYYDVKNDKLIDPLGGIEDIKNKTVSAADEPDKVFGEDGLRILRLVRQASEFGFDVEKSTFESAKKLVARLNDIAPERIQTEINRVFVADAAHPELNTADAHIKGVRLLDALGALELIFPELTAMRGLKQKPQYHIYDAFEHSLKAFELSPPSIRLAALLHDVGKLPCQLKQGNMHGHDAVGAEMVRERLTALKYPKNVVDRTVKLIALHMYDLRGETSEGKIRLFLVKNSDVAEELFMIQRADCFASRGEQAVYTERLEKIYAEMKGDGTPFSVKDLKISGQDLVEIGIEPAKRAEILDSLLRDAVLNSELRSRESQLGYLKRRNS